MLQESFMRPEGATLRRSPRQARESCASRITRHRSTIKFAAAVAVTGAASLISASSAAQTPSPEKPIAARSTYLVTPEHPEGQLIEGDEIASDILPPEKLCEPCVLEVRCSQAVVREDVPFQRIMEQGGIIRMKVGDIRGKTITPFCAGDDIAGFILYVPRYEDPLGVPLAPLSRPPSIETVPMPESAAPADASAAPADASAPSVPHIDKGPPPVFLTYLDRPDKEVTGDTVARNKKLDPRLALHCQKGDAPVFDPTPDTIDLQFDPPPSTWVSAPLNPMSSLKVKCGNGTERIITVVDEAVKAAAPKAEMVPSLRPWSVEAGTEIPVTSTHDFFNGAGAYIQGTRQLPSSLGSIRGSARVAWNPITQRPATDDPAFVPQNPRQRFRGNAVRATLGAAYPLPLHDGSDFNLDLQAGGDVGAAFINVGPHRDVAVNQAGDLADVPAYDGVTAVIEGHAELAANFGKRLRLALGLRYGQSPFAVQTRAAARRGANLNYLHANAGFGVQF